MFVIYDINVRKRLSGLMCHGRKNVLDYQTKEKLCGKYVECELPLNINLWAGYFYIKLTCRGLYMGYWCLICPLFDHEFALKKEISKI